MLAYGYDNSKIHVMPECVLFAENKTQVQNIVIYCLKIKFLLLLGKSYWQYWWICANERLYCFVFEKMKKIIEIDIANRIAIVEPGVINKYLQDSLAEHNFFWGPDPQVLNILPLGEI